MLHLSFVIHHYWRSAQAAAVVLAPMIGRHSQSHSQSLAFVKASADHFAKPSVRLPAKPSFGFKRASAERAHLQIKVKL